MLIKGIICRIVRSYLALFDRGPFLVSVAGLVGTSTFFILIGWAYQILAEVLGVNYLVAAALLAPLAIVAFCVALVVVMLANECLWRGFRIYELLQISGWPIHNHIKKLVGKE